MLRLVIVAALAALALPSAAGAAAPKHCGHGATELHGIVRGTRILLRGDRGPVIACLRPSKRHGYAALARTMRDRRMYAPALRRFIRRRIPHLRAHDATFDRVLARHLAPVATAARVRHDLGTGAIVQDGITMTGTAWEILADPDELPIPERKGFDLRGDLKIGGLDARKHKNAYTGSFAKRCPDARGASKGDYEAHVFEEVAQEVPGPPRIRVIVSEDFHTTATFEGHVGDDARLEDFDIEIRFTLEIKARVEGAASGDVIGRATTQVYRGFATLKGLRPDGTGTLAAIAAGRGSLAVRGPKGADVGAAFGSAFVLAQSEAVGAAAHRLHEAEQWWYGDEDAYLPESRHPGNCVELKFEPDELTLDEGETGPVDVRMTAKSDGAEVAARHRLTPDEFTHGHATPPTATSTPGRPARFQYTAPRPRPFDDEDPFTAVRVEATSKRGRAQGAIDARIPLARVFRVTFAATGHKSRDEPPYTLQTEQGPLTWELQQTSAFSWRVTYPAVAFDSRAAAAVGVSRTHSASGTFHSTGNNASMPFDCGDAIREGDPAQSPELRGIRLADGSWRLAVAALAKGWSLWSDSADCTDPTWAAQGAWVMWDEGPHDASTTAYVTVTPEQLEQDHFTVHVQPAPGAEHPERCHRVSFFDLQDPDGPYDCTYEFAWTGTVTFDR